MKENLYNCPECENRKLLHGKYPGFCFWCGTNRISNIREKRIK